jgi:hypothetical protein
VRLEFIVYDIVFLIERKINYFFFFFFFIAGAQKRKANSGTKMRLERITGAVVADDDTEVIPAADDTDANPAAEYDEHKYWCCLFFCCCCAAEW